MNSIRYLTVRVVLYALSVLFSLSGYTQSGNACSALQVNVTANESRCRATGSILIAVTGGSGQYNYRVAGPINTTYTSTNNISGLIPGTYTVFVSDILAGCVRQVDNISILGSYTDPRFTLNSTNVTCKNTLTGSLQASEISGGRSQFWFTITSAPSASDVGRANATGFFGNLRPGEYSVRMEDSCGAIQTRRASILPYDWWVDSVRGNMVSCSTATFIFSLRDSRGKLTPDSVFSGFRYGWVRGNGDTAWNTSPNFNANIQKRRSVVLVVKDGCGNLVARSWANTYKPAVDATVNTTQSECNVFTATVTGVVNMTNPQFCLYNSAYDQLECNSTGVFGNLVQDNYTVEVRDLCYDTLVRRNFSLVNPKPDVTAAPTVNRTSCTMFNVQMTGLINFTNPQFCLFRNDVQLSCNQTGFFKNLQNGTYEVRITDGCYDTIVVREVDVQSFKPTLAENVVVFNRTCTTFDVRVEGQANLTLPQYSLWKNNVQVASNTTGTFTGILYGDYCIRMVNSPTCYDTTLIRCFRGEPFKPAVAENLTVQRECNTVTIRVSGQQYLTNPEYCLFDDKDNQIQCNTSGVFPDMPYGAYCVKIKNDPACFDTTILRCEVIEKTKPSAGPVLQSNASCLTFDAEFSGQASVYNPVYTLKDASGNIIATNTTGSFTGLAYAQYCMEMKNDPLCYDTTIVRCFTGIKPVPSGGSVSYSDLTCPSFTATVSGLVNFNNPTYILKNALGVVLGTNSTGVFTGLTYQDYCVEIKNDPQCYDTSVVTCFAAIPPVPNVGDVQLDGYTCGTFNATVTGQYLLTNPVYQLLDSAGNQVSSNASGIFNDLAYGSYTIRIVDGCVPTPFVRPFTAIRPPFQVEASALAACEQGKTTISVDLRNGSQPYVVTVYDPTNNVVGNVVSNAGIVEVRDLAALPNGLQYRVVVVDSCGRMGTQMVTPVLNQITKSLQFVQRCPSGADGIGSSDVNVTVSSTAGPVYPVIILKNDVPVNIPYGNQAGRTFTFLDLAPGTYVIMYNLPNGCANKLYDTVQVNPYTFPVFSNAVVYQCSNNVFTVSAEISGGAPAYQYQIIGSMPALPSIQTDWQSSPVFTINNGTQYSLVRLRAIDACGNAALNDANVLPLQNLVVTATSTCLNAPTILRVDQVPNADYQWYRINRATGDSIFLGTGNTYLISDVKPADTGLYKVIMTINGGCLERVATFELTGECLILPVRDIRLTGEISGSAARLNWQVAGEQNVRRYDVEHSTERNGGFRIIGAVDPRTPQGNNSYGFQHGTPSNGNNFYRIRVLDAAGNARYSNTIALNWSGTGISVYPVPASQVVYVTVNAKQQTDLKIQLYTPNGQLLQEKVMPRTTGGTLPLYRQNYASGMYLVRITDTSGGMVLTQKIIFE
jgi:hypothetical protein